MNSPNQHFRVAIVVNSCWNLHNFRRGLIDAIVGAGHEVFLLAPIDGTEESITDLPGTFIPLRHLKRSGTRVFRELLLIHEINRIYKRHRIDRALHFTAKPVVYGSLAARWAGVESIATLTGLGYTFLHGRFRSMFMKRLYAFALKRAETVFYHNPDDRALLLDAGVGTEKRSFVVGGSGLPLDKFTVKPYDLAVPGRFLFVGRLIADKGIREFVDAARSVKAKHPELGFHIVGAPDPGNPASISNAELDAWAKEDNIVFHGQVKDVRPQLEQASVVVLPSYREGCPRSLLEAAATGRALIGTDVPGVREVVVGGRNGWLVPAKNTGALVRAMEVASKSNEEELKKMGEYSRELVMCKFSEDRILDEYLFRMNGGEEAVDYEGCCFEGGS